MTSKTGSQQFPNALLRVLYSTHNCVFPRCRCCVGSYSSFNTGSFLSVRAGVICRPGTSGPKCAGLKTAERHVAARHGLVCRFTKKHQLYGASAPPTDARLEIQMTQVVSIFTSGLKQLHFSSRKPADLQNLAPGTHPPFITFNGEVKTDVNKIEEFLEDILCPPK